MGDRSKGKQRTLAEREARYRLLPASPAATEHRSCYRKVLSSGAIRRGSSDGTRGALTRSAALGHREMECINLQPGLWPCAQSYQSASKESWPPLVQDLLSKRFGDLMHHLQGTGQLMSAQTYADAANCDIAVTATAHHTGHLCMVRDDGSLPSHNRCTRATEDEGAKHATKHWSRRGPGVPSKHHHVAGPCLKLGCLCHNVVRSHQPFIVP